MKKWACPSMVTATAVPGTPCSAIRGWMAASTMPRSRAGSGGERASPPAARAIPFHQGDLADRRHDIAVGDKAVDLETRRHLVGGGHPSSHGLLALEPPFAEEDPFGVFGAVPQEAFVVAPGDGGVGLFEDGFASGSWHGALMVLDGRMVSVDTFSPGQFSLPARTFETFGTRGAARFDKLDPPTRQRAACPMRRGRTMNHVVPSTQGAARDSEPTATWP